nr:hypothetical protein CFP56_22248 [Quercus suber]
MPVLKQIWCSVILSNGTPLTEYATKYKDGIVETYIAVPDTPQSFFVRVTSEGFLAEGLGAFIYIDGKYQANRNRVDLKHPAYGVPSSSYEIDFRFRQKEEMNGPESFVGRAWTFATLGSSDDAQAWSENDAKYIGNIEVVILRCRSRDTIPVGILSRSVLPPKELSKYRDTLHVKNKKTRVRETHELPEEDTEGIFGDGLLGIFDGVADEIAEEHDLITSLKDKPTYRQPTIPGPKCKRSISPGQHSQLLNGKTHSCMLDGPSDSDHWDWNRPQNRMPDYPHHQVQHNTRRADSNGRAQPHDPFWDAVPQDTRGGLGQNCSTHPRVNDRNPSPQVGNTDQTFARDPSGYVKRAPYFERPPNFENQVRCSINGRAGVFERTAAGRQFLRPKFRDDVVLPAMSKSGDNADYLRVPKFDNDASFAPTPQFGMYKQFAPKRTLDPQHHTFDGPPGVSNHYGLHSNHPRCGTSKLGMNHSEHQDPLSVQYDPFAPGYDTNGVGKGAAYTVFREHPPPPHQPPISHVGMNGGHVGTTMRTHGQAYQQQHTPANTPFRDKLQPSGSIDLGRNTFARKDAPSQNSLPGKSVNLAPQKVDLLAEVTRFAQKPKYNLLRLANGLENYLNLMRSRTLHYTSIIESALPGIENNILSNHLKHTELIIHRVEQVYSRLKEVQNSGVSAASLRLPGGLPPHIYHMLGLAVPEDALHFVDDVDQALNPAQPVARISGNKVDDAWGSQPPKKSDAGGNDWAASQAGEHRNRHRDHQNFNTSDNPGAANAGWETTPNDQANNDAANWAEGNNNNDAGDWGNNSNKNHNDATSGWANDNQNDDINATWPKDNGIAAQGADWAAASSHSKKSNNFAANTNAPTNCNNTNNVNIKTDSPSYFADWPRKDSIRLRQSTLSTRNAHIYPATPLPCIPVSLQQQRTHGVQAGEGAQYEHVTRRPDYLDSMSQPYAVIRFKYRSVDALKKKFNTDQIENVSAEQTTESFDKLSKTERGKYRTQAPRVTVEARGGVAKDRVKPNLGQSTLQGLVQKRISDFAAATSAIDDGVADCHRTT